MNTYANQNQENRYLESPYSIVGTGFGSQIPFHSDNPFVDGFIFASPKDDFPTPQSPRPNKIEENKKIAIETSPDSLL